MSKKTKQKNFKTDHCQVSILNVLVFPKVPAAFEIHYQKGVYLLFHYLDYCGISVCGELAYLQST